MFRFTGSYCLLWLITSLQLVAQSTQIHYLCGTDKENPAQWDFLIDKGRKSGSWQKNNVPSCWEMEGFGEYSFGSLPFNEKAVYQYQFIALPSWQGKHINLVFEGMLTDTKVKLNRQTIGISGYMRFSFNVSAALKYSTSNEREVVVNKRSTEPFNVSAPMWLFGGTYKPVYLEILPEKHITYLAVETQAITLFMKIGE